MRRIILAITLAAACRGAGDHSPPATDAADSAIARRPDTARSAAPPAAPAATGLVPCATPTGRDSLCFHADRAYDFAADGRPFTILVDARGPAPDSMRVALRITRGDTVFHRADWTTALYGRYDRHAVSADSARRRAARHLARLLADSAFLTTRQVLRGAANVDAMLREAIAFDVAVDAERRRHGLTPADTLPTTAAQSPRATPDSARVRALVSELRDANAFRYYAGGEASYAVAWSRTERRFVIVFACC